MATTSDFNRSFIAAAAVEAGRLVKQMGTGATKAGSGDAILGVAVNEAGANEPVTVRLWSRWGTMLCVADGAIAVGDALYAGADGKVTKTVAGSQIGVALTQTTADGQQIEVLPS